MQLHFKIPTFCHLQYAQTDRPNSFDPDDLLEGISRTLLASILLHDVVSARAHLAAAAALVRQTGDIGAIDHRIAANLRYADFHLAVATLRAPLFAAVVSIPPAPMVDAALVKLASHVRTNLSAADVPKVVVPAVQGLVDAIPRLWLTHSMSRPQTELTSQS